MKNKNTIESLKKEKLITTADKIPIKSIKLLSKEDLYLWNTENSVFDADKINKQIERLKVLEILEDYCSSLGITPTDLIAFHKELSKKRNLKAKTTQETHVSDNPESGKTIKNRNHSNWREDYIKNKTGI